MPVLWSILMKCMKQWKKLVLFDIDGTLIYHVGKEPGGWQTRFAHGMKAAWNIDASSKMEKYNGYPDWASGWESMKQFRITKKQYEKGFPRYIESMHTYLQELGKTDTLYKAIPDAVTLAMKLKTNKKFCIGIISGNAKRIGLWKLEHCELGNIFDFALYGDDATDRIALAQTIFDKAQAFFHMEFLPQDITVIGDTIHDVRCGKAIGAMTIGVTTGMHEKRSILEDEHPDIVVDSLMDERVLSLLGLEQ